MFKRKNKATLRRFSNRNLMGGYMKRFSVQYIALLFLVAIFEVALLIRESTLVRSSMDRHILYFVCYSILLVASLASAIFLIIQRKKQGNEIAITIVIHVYALIAIMWGCAVSLLDYYGGDQFPAVYFTILATIGGLLVLNPFISVPTMVFFDILMLVGMYLVNSEFLNVGNVINFIVLAVMIAIVTFHTSVVAVAEEDERSILMKVSNTDVLTGLKNENAYYRFLDKLDKKSAKEDIDYAVVVMDLNGLKNVDDTYGHRYGAHLISQTGRILPTVFKNCDIFHTGGDEFVCIITKEYANKDIFLEEFAKKLEYQIVNFEGQELVLSVSRGIALHKKNEKYNDTYQRADRDMYKNKPIIKQKYNIVGR